MAQEASPENASQVSPQRAEAEPLHVFSHVVEPRWHAYRAIMSVFAAAKRRYVIQLRPSEVLAELERAGRRIDVPNAGIEDLLDQLVAWGNLRRNHDTASAQTLEEFQRRRSIYLLTPAGEAAEQAIARVLDVMERSGSLQKVMFGAILDKLRRIRQTARHDPVDSALLYQTFSELFADFDKLTDNASLFLSSTQKALDTETYNTEVFQAYKYAVIDYLQGFVNELNRQEESIKEAILAVEELNASQVIAIAARETRAPTLDGRTLDERAELEAKWTGLRLWFIGHDSTRPHAEGLRTAATNAIARMLRILNHINEQRFRRVSRVADFVQLAHWFEDAPSDAAAHMLYRDAFGLAGARHMTELPDQEEAPANQSWSESPPVVVPWATRAIARPSRAGRPGKREDHTEAKRRLREARLEREARLNEALQVFAGRGPLRATEFPTLGREAMEALLDFLDACLTTRSRDRTNYQARSHDGRFMVTLRFNGDKGEAAIRSTSGTLHTRDFTILVEEAR